MNLVKAEILFSRKCNLHCSYCAMADGRENTLSVEEWKKGIDNLKELGVGFIAYYGAEPLLEITKLAPIIRYTEEQGIPCTVITSGGFRDIKEKLQLLIYNGLKSLTMSFDILPHDESSLRKSMGAIHILEWFKEQCPNCRDVAAVTTLHKKNYHMLNDSINLLSSKSIWTFFDLYHYDRGHKGTKVAGKDKSLMFDAKSKEKLIDVLIECGKQKNEHNKLVHLDEYTFSTLIRNDFEPIWNCSHYEQFPSWLTIDCDGLVYPCDDFVNRNLRQFPITQIAKQINEFTEYWSNKVRQDCKGCQWVTHIQAHSIKEGILNMEDYVHDNK